MLYITKFSIIEFGNICKQKLEMSVSSDNYIFPFLNENIWSYFFIAIPNMKLLPIKINLEIVSRESKFNQNCSVK